RGQAEPSEEAAEDSTSDESSQNESPEDDAEENGQEDASEETTEEQNGEQSDASADNSENYTAAEQCIMSEFTECENIEANDQYQAYDNLVANGTLPQAPISDCLPCAVSILSKLSTVNHVKSILQSCRGQAKHREK